MNRFKKKLSTTYHLPPTDKRSAFTLLELVLFTAIFSVIIIAFISVLVSITSTQVRQTAVTEVNQQSQFVLQALQFYVQRSSLIEEGSDIATTSVKLRMPASVLGSPSSEDPTLIFASGTQVFSKVGSNAPQALTSNRVLVSGFILKKHHNPGGKDTLSASFTISYNTENSQQKFTQSLSSAVARVNAATFDSDLTPSVDGTQNIGGAGSYWSTINGILMFNSADSNAVGIGIAPGTGFSGLQVHNGDVYVDTAANGLVLKNGSNCFRVTVSATGNIATSTATCY